MIWQKTVKRVFVEDLKTVKNGITTTQHKAPFLSTNFEASYLHTRLSYFDFVGTFLKRTLSYFLLDCINFLNIKVRTSFSAANEYPDESDLKQKILEILEVGPGVKLHGIEELKWVNTKNLRFKNISKNTGIKS